MCYLSFDCAKTLVFISLHHFPPDPGPSSIDNDTDFTEKLITNKHYSIKSRSTKYQNIDLT